MSVSVDSGGKGGKKKVDSEVNMVPFIDLLVVTISFLIITAVWTQLERLNATQQTPGQAQQMDQPQEERIRLILQINDAGFTLADTAGTRIPIPKQGGKYDLNRLSTELRNIKRQDPNRRDLIVSPEDGVKYQDIIAAMDFALRDSDDRDNEPDFPDISVSDASGTGI
ncbi:MAG: biopolymer transporter ExbD [Deltaproteobacteria bacterium]|nr:biopolymer transporter ExbD [Deltaproteobacteria bacterium]